MLDLLIAGDAVRDKMRNQLEPNGANRVDERDGRIALLASALTARLTNVRARQAQRSTGQPACSESGAR